MNSKLESDHLEAYEGQWRHSKTIAPTARGVRTAGEHATPAGGLEGAAVSYTKGCYLGQEVMARLKRNKAFYSNIWSDLSFEEKLVCNSYAREGFWVTK
jgi:folate-binding protein YgfZ